MLVDECICTYYDKYYEKKKQAQENLLKSVRDRLLSYIEMLPTALFISNLETTQMPANCTAKNLTFPEKDLTFALSS